jgi:GST-like protein
MIDLYFASTPNAWKASIMLNECALDHRIVPVDLGRRDQKRAPFLAINPNGRVPAIVDHDGVEGPVTLFESGAILLYLAEKTGRFLPPSGGQRATAMSWLFWQAAGLGPISGQAHHFAAVSGQAGQYGQVRFKDECDRLYGVLDRHLAGRQWIADTYSIADISCWGWIWFNGDLVSRFANVERWFDRMAERPAVERGRLAGLDAAPEEMKAQFSAPRFGKAPWNRSAEPGARQSVPETQL